jgi:TetR/AcrR family tetracycline transcriptional repressor
MIPETATDNRRLTRNQVARAALELLDREGLEGLSMRKLAAGLGVGTMTLYGYFRGKRELLDAVVDVAAEDFEAPPPGGSLRDEVIAYALAARAWLLRHPALVGIRSDEAILRPAALRISEPQMQRLLDAGLPPDEAARAFRTLFIHLFGSAAFAAREPGPEERRALQAAMLTLPEDEFPAMLATAPHAADVAGGEDQFRYGVERILDGVGLT